MGDKTGIEWTDATWNPIRGCSRVSAGCEHCYAERQAHRMNHPGGPYEGLTVLGKHGPRWTGKMRQVPEMLDKPIRWQRPRLIFVNSMSDLFHPGVPFEYIAAVFGIMLRAEHHTFQVLTKRPERMLEFFKWLNAWRELPYVTCLVASQEHVPLTKQEHVKYLGTQGWRWPLPNVWLGTSVEDQKSADLRVPLILKVEAVVKWLSMEPLLGPVDLADLEPGKLDWVVVGGESGPGARRMEPEWARVALFQCGYAGVPVMFKQLGAVWAKDVKGSNKKGGNWEVWPDTLRVRQYPRGVLPSASRTAA